MVKGVTPDNKILCSSQLECGRHWELVGARGSDRRKECAGRWKGQVDEGRPLTDLKISSSILEEGDEGSPVGKIKEKHS